MALLPKLVLRCQRCHQPREGVRHVCRSNSNRAATVKLKLDNGKCPKCKKPTTFLGIGHTCTSKRGDFGRRKKAFVKSQTAKKRASSKHTYSACPDPKNCQRTACVAYREGISTGRLEGYDEGYSRGYGIGIQSCTLPHGVHDDSSYRPGGHRRLRARLRGLTDPSVSGVQRWRTQERQAPEVLRTL